MNEIAKELQSKVAKEAAKNWMKVQMTPPGATLQQRMEIEQYVENAARCADQVEALAKAYNMDLRTTVFLLFGLY